MAGMVNAHSLNGRVVVRNTDREPSMVKTGRIQTEQRALAHVGCDGHRLEDVTTLVFDGPGVKKFVCLARVSVTHYTKSTKAADHLQEMCGTVRITLSGVI